MIKRMAIALAIVAASCSPVASSDAKAPATARGVHPQSGLRFIPLTIQRGKRKLTFRVEVAASSEEQARGLMFRTAMGANEGMIFPMKPPRGAAFWMRNTVIPLDIIFIGTDRRITNIAAKAVPYSEESLPSVGLVSAVLELNGGRAAELGIVAGDKIDW